PQVFYRRAQPPLKSPLFPYTTLFRSVEDLSEADKAALEQRVRKLKLLVAELRDHIRQVDLRPVQGAIRELDRPQIHLPDVIAQPDRKSTRLNSSHDQISYGVACMKQK